MKRFFVTTSMMLPRLSDKAAAQLLDVLSQLFDAMQHHYGSQARRWQRQQCRPHHAPSVPPCVPPVNDDPF